jgi:hypothetical protein
MTQRWEYWSGAFTTSGALDKMTKAANERGLAGWEMVNHTVNLTQSSDRWEWTVTCVMKRPKSETA